MASKILNLGNKDCGEEEEEPPVSNSGTSSGTSSSSSESDGYRDDPLGPCQSKSDCPSDAQFATKTFVFWIIKHLVLQIQRL